MAWVSRLFGHEDHLHLSNVEGARIPPPPWFAGMGGILACSLSSEWGLPSCKDVESQFTSTTMQLREKKFASKLQMSSDRADCPDSSHVHGGNLFHRTNPGGFYTIEIDIETSPSSQLATSATSIQRLDRPVLGTYTNSGPLHISLACDGPLFRKSNVNSVPPHTTSTLHAIISFKRREFLLAILYERHIPCN